MKSEPDTYGIANLAKDGVGQWDGVRNYQARNFIRMMSIGNMVIFYHSNARTATGAVGEMEVIQTAYPDPTQFDPMSPYVDYRSTPTNPRWSTVGVRYVRTFNRCVTLDILRTMSALQDCRLLARGNRLSVLPLTPHEYQAIVQYGTSTR